jgi:hypothetical protein
LCHRYVTLSVSCVVYLIYASPLTLRPRRPRPNVSARGSLGQGNAAVQAWNNLHNTEKRPRKDIFPKNGHALCGFIPKWFYAGWGHSRNSSCARVYGLGFAANCAICCKGHIAIESGPFCSFSQFLCRFLTYAHMQTFLSQRLCVQVGFYGTVLHAVYIGTFVAPHWHTKVVDKIDESGTSGTQALNPKP